MDRRPLSSTLPLLSSEPFESPVWANVSECRKERKAAKSANQISHTVQISGLECAICTIYIGHDFVEQELYLLTLPAGSPIHLADNEYPQVFPKPKTFSICGGCAKRRQLPESACVIRAYDWTRLEVSPGEYLSILPTNAEQTAQVLLQLKTRILHAQRSKAQESAVKSVKKESVEQVFTAMRTLPKLPTLPSLSSLSAVVVVTPTQHIA